MTTSAINSNTPITGNTSNSSTPATLPGQDLANEQTFLQLFVAQLKNQDPLNPNSQDPTQMLSELEQSLQLNSTVSNIDSLLVANQNASAGTTATNSTTNANGVQGS